MNTKNDQYIFELRLLRTLEKAKCFNEINEVLVNLDKGKMSKSEAIDKIYKKAWNPSENFWRLINAESEQRDKQFLQRLKERKIDF